jgi:hypothetical protein
MCAGLCRFKTPGTSDSFRTQGSVPRSFRRGPRGEIESLAGLVRFDGRLTTPARPVASLAPDTVTEGERIHETHHHHSQSLGRTPVGAGLCVFVFALAMALGGAASAMVHQYGTVVSGLTGAADRARTTVRRSSGRRATFEPRSIATADCSDPITAAARVASPRGGERSTGTAFPTGSPSRTCCRATSSIHPRRLEPGARS